MNNYKYRKSTTVFDKRLKEIVSKFKREFNNGKIKTETDYAYNVKQAVINFYNTLGKPSFQLHKASDIPSFPHYIDMVKKAKDDMETLLYGCSSISDSIVISENEMNDTIEMLTKRTDGVLMNVSNLEKKIKSLRNAKDVVFSDTFTKDLNKYKEVNDNYENFADTANGVLTLKPNKNKRIMDGFNIEILNTSNGFPGNTHEVYYSISNLMNNNIKYKGENNPNLNLKNIIRQDSDGSWFEFEMFNLDEDVKAKTSGVGFLYKEDISWITEDDVLKLNLKMYSDTPVKSNFFKITSIPKVNSNVTNPILRKITVSDEMAEVQSITVNKELVDSIIVTFSSQMVKSIIIEIEQPEGYLTDVCRQYALNIDPTRIPYFFNDEFKDYIQIEQPKETRSSIELLGLKYNQNDSTFTYPSTKNENTFLTNEYIKSQLFYNNKSTNNYKIQNEVVKAIRYSIGIKNIDLRIRSYLENGIYVSEEFVTTEPIKTLTFNSTDYIPIKFKDYLKKDEDFNSFIKYYISFDNGSNWHSINPRHKAHMGPCTIVINSNSIVSNRNKNIIYIDMLYEPSSFIVKIELSRPVEVNDESPIIYEYNVNVSAEEDI